MKKCIISTHYNRPNCTKDGIEHLKRCTNINEWDVLFYLDPSPVTDEIQHIINQSQIGTGIMVYPELVGAWGNNKYSLLLAFALGYDYVVRVQDDTLIAKDGLEFLDWGCRTFYNDPEIFHVCCWQRKNEERYQPHALHACQKMQQYSDLGVGLWKHKWDVPETWTGSDNHVEKHMIDTNRFGIFPIISRSNHIGYDNGTTSNPQLKDLVNKLGHDTFAFDGKTYTNYIGSEWIKLDENNIRSRNTVQSYIDEYLHTDWAENMVKEKFWVKPL